jgi:hypothetical protein
MGKIENLHIFSVLTVGAVIRMLLGFTFQRLVCESCSRPTVNCSIWREASGLERMLQINPDPRSPGSEFWSTSPLLGTIISDQNQKFSFLVDLSNFTRKKFMLYFLTLLVFNYDRYLTFLYGSGTLLGMIVSFQVAVLRICDILVRIRGSKFQTNGSETC